MKEIVSKLNKYMPDDKIATSHTVQKGMTL